MTIWIFLFFFLFITKFYSQVDYKPAPENVENREWFQDAKFGLFIHWGVYSILMDGEWVMQNRRINKNDYKKLPQFFNPTEFDASVWVKMAKDAGMKYIVITSRHHDGFSMFETTQSPYNIVEATPFKRDVLKELAEACREAGIKLGFYYSHLDWYHDDYYPRGDNPGSKGRPLEGDWDKYIVFMKDQLTELLTNYGDVLCIWFDGWWDKPKADWRLDEQYNLIHALQPGTLIGNNHHRPVKSGEDFQMYERDLPGHNTTGYSDDAKVGYLPLEMCETMAGHSWGYNFTDNRFKTSTRLIHTLVKAAGYNSNLLLNVGPMPNGKIQQENLDTLAIIGEFMEEYGETIYNTRQGLITPRPWGVTTMRDNLLFIHILDHPDLIFNLPPLEQGIQQITAFKTGEKIDYVKNNTGIRFTIPESLNGEVDRVIVLELIE